ncbi:MAG: hypothetical protein HY459_01250 [Parcubacteria group bacterium]|nr:hypothetical protein [Parcubacteria group bacterium]
MSHLLEFYGTECPHCQRMHVLVERLEKEEGLTVDRHEVWHNEDNARKMTEYDRGFCGGVPFFYNTKTEQWICGEVQYADFKLWAKGT